MPPEGSTRAVILPGCPKHTGEVERQRSGSNHRTSGQYIRDPTTCAVSPPVCATVASKSRKPQSKLLACRNQAIRMSQKLFSMVDNHLQLTSYKPGIDGTLVPAANLTITEKWESVGYIAKPGRRLRVHLVQELSSYVLKVMVLMHNTFHFAGVKRMPNFAAELCMSSKMVCIFEGPERESSISSAYSMSCMTRPLLRMDYERDVAL
ncbi:hypothetical protein CSKR_106834 [Clonorchis sinensis]|uniref:Uncharacterized protein n=1 Tax=Clonorchis sinensis TaxID=79923 RepID=A0A419PUN2_CLOSI|nr:hypothetical protein CSKR_106834 [Clonorchis sinensis]